MKAVTFGKFENYEYRGTTYPRIGILIDNEPSSCYLYGYDGYQFMISEDIIDPGCIQNISIGSLVDPYRRIDIVSDRAEACIITEALALRSIYRFCKSTNMTLTISPSTDIVSTVNDEFVKFVYAYIDNFGPRLIKV